MIFFQTVNKHVAKPRQCTLTYGHSIILRLMAFEIFYSGGMWCVRIKESHLICYIVKESISSLPRKRYRAVWKTAYFAKTCERQVFFAIKTRRCGVALIFFYRILLKTHGRGNGEVTWGKSTRLKKTRVCMCTKIIITISDAANPKAMFWLFAGTILLSEQLQ